LVQSSSGDYQTELEQLERFLYDLRLIYAKTEKAYVNEAGETVQNGQAHVQYCIYQNINIVFLGNSASIQQFFSGAPSCSYRSLLLKFPKIPLRRISSVEDNQTAISKGNILGHKHRNHALPAKQRCIKRCYWSKRKTAKIYRTSSLIRGRQPDLRDAHFC